MPFLVPVDRKKIWDRERKQEIENSEEAAFVTPIFFRLVNDREDKLPKFWEISPKQIEENQRQSQIVADERLPSWSLCLISKIILIIFTAENDSPNLAHCLWWLLVTMESENIKMFWKNITLARAQILSKITMGPP